ncbi:MAG: universal stress protein [Alphaproteobacteria bacterium]|nr:universal stress protein [Rhodospirillales bacterium]MCW9045202.1 universal stress protein [Alphaproteobacteria bacterium]
MIGSILVPLAEPDMDENAVRMAFLLAQKFCAHVECLHIHPPILKKVPYVSEAMARRTDQIVSRVREQEAQEVRHAEYIFGKVRREIGLDGYGGDLSESRPSASWNIQTGNEEALIAERGRVFDLIVVAQPQKSSKSASRTTLKAAIFKTARPVLMVPRNWSSSLGNSVLVSWNASSLSARAVSAAVPFLRRANSVSILHVTTGAKGGPSAKDLAQYLIWQDIQTGIREIEPQAHSVGETILSEADSIGADLIVIGAHSLNRLSEVILGGVTNYLTSHAEVPVLMAH